MTTHAIINDETGKIIGRGRKATHTRKGLPIFNVPVRMLDTQAPIDTEVNLIGRVAKPAKRRARTAK